MEQFEIEQMLKEASEALLAGRFHESFNLFSEAISQGVHDESVLLARAVSLLRLENFDDAEKAFLLALYHYPTSQTAISQLEQLGGAYTLPLVFLPECNKLPSQATPLPIQETPSGVPSRPWYKLSGVQLLGSHGLVLSSDWRILHATEPSCTNYISTVRNRVSITELHRQSRRALNGRYMCLLGHWSDAFFHWMIEYLPQAIKAEQAGLECTYLINEQPKFIGETLAYIGVPPERIVIWDSLPSIVEELILPPHLPASVCEGYPERLSLLRESLLARVNVDSPRRERLYIRRSNPERPRRVVNSEELEKMLASYDFRPIELERLTFDEQVKLMSSCDAIVTPHGAAMVHALLMPERSLVVEMFSPTYINPCMMKTIFMLGHRYHMVVSYLNHGQTYDLGQDIDAAIMPIELAIRAWCADRAADKCSVATKAGYR